MGVTSADCPVTFPAAHRVDGFAVPCRLALNAAIRSTTCVMSRGIASLMFSNTSSASRTSP
jgi:hypothetical protein